MRKQFQYRKSERFKYLVIVQKVKTAIENGRIHCGLVEKEDIFDAINFHLTHLRQWVES